MKKVFKKVILIFVLVLFLLALAIGVAMWFVFTPEKLTPIIRNQVTKNINCESKIGEVELSFFSTFPRFGLKVSHFALVNPCPNAPEDTLIVADQFVGVIDIFAWWKRNELVLTELQLLNGTLNAFVDSLGHTNFDIFLTDSTITSVDTAQFVQPFSFVNIENVKLENINISYIDQSQKLQSRVQNLNAQFSGSFLSDTVKANIKVTKGLFSLKYDGENYLSEASIQLNSPVEFILSQQLLLFDNADVSVNNMNITFDGSIENDTVHDRIITDINYKSEFLPIPVLLTLIPSSYQSYLKGIEANGLVSSTGKIKGFYSDQEWPLLDLQFLVKDASLKYEDFPVPLRQINGDLVFYSDLQNDSLSYFRINHFSAQTPQSFIKTNGVFTHLFTDIKCNLSSEGNIIMKEFKPMIPTDMKMDLNGSVSGKIESIFSMSQIEKMQFDKMKLSGSLALSNFNVTYDSLSLMSDYSKVDFALPNLNSSSKTMRFVTAKIDSKSLDVSKLKGFQASLKNAVISLQTSDVRDTTRIPEVACTFAVDSISANMDTIQLNIQNPEGQFIMFPQKERRMEPEIKLNYSCRNLASSFGAGYARMNNVKLNTNVQYNKIQPKMKLEYCGTDLEMAMGSDSARMNKIDLNADIINDQNQKDFFLQWLVKGFVNVDKGVISMSSLKYPLEIPSVKMDFNPEILNIKESKLKIDKSDFSLSGSFNNVLSYFRKDSLLRGNFNFVSNNTDVLELMQLTSGLGEKDSVKTMATTEDASTGPYMVPKGIDILLNTDIRTATFGIDTATGIKGSVRVKDGLLVLDDYNLTTAAAKIKLTAMYRSPRKNHLYLGLDCQLLDVEIEELLKIIPDVDSLMPMLRSFRGKGEFHMAAETYTDSLYNPKKSTIRGAASIKGQDLVLMDGETFSEIAKTLRFNKKTYNKVDSISAEFTLFKNEIDVYPFLIVMDKYKGVVSGQHNLDLSFNYHISIVDSPLPLKFGIDISGTMDNLKYRPTTCKYAEFYRPASRYVVQNKQLELRRLIRESLTQAIGKE